MISGLGLSGLLLLGAPPASAAVVPVGPLPLNTSTTVHIAAGDSARYTFTGATGRRLTLQFTGQVVDIDPYFATSRILTYEPDGTLFDSEPISAYPDWHLFFAETPPLPSAGTWSVVIEPTGEQERNGTYTFTPRLTADQKSTLTPGKKLTTKIDAPGQQARYTFSGNKGRRITLDSSALKWKDSLDGRQTSPAELYLIRPDGSAINPSFWPVQPYNSAGATFQELNYGDYRHQGLLDATGTWTLVVDPFADVTGSQTFTLNLISDVKSTLTRGTAKKITLTTRGQQSFSTFSWNGAGSLKWSVIGSAFTGRLSIISPSGTWYEPALIGKGTTKNGQPLRGDSENGTWTAAFDAYGIATGSATIKLG